MSKRPLAIALSLLLVLPAVRPRALAAQIIQIKTLPIADGEQWRFFPSANQGLGGLSIALRDSLLDPFDNPARGSEVSAGSRGFVFGSPSFYSLSKNAGGGRTLPLGGIMRRGSVFGGFAVAVQQIDDTRQQGQVIFAPNVDVAVVNSVAPPAPTTPPRHNQFAFATLGRVFERAGVSVGASALWSGLNYIDGVDLLYAGSQNIAQHGGAMDLRLGLLKEWAGARSLEAIVLHDDFDMTHDVTWADSFWDPNARTFVQKPRLQHNLDRTKTWGLHLGYTQPIADSGWRAGAILTTNLMSHPKLPDYQFAQITTIPWDPGHSAAYDLGIGIAKALGLTRFGIDAIYEPIRTHTWGESPDSIVTALGTRPAGSKTTENWFRFSNAIIRTGVSREIPMDSLRVSLKALRLEGGLAMRSVNYVLDQTNHVMQTQARQNQSWMEWTRTWGFGIRFTDLEFRYTGRTTTGTGRPGIVDQGNGNVFPATAGDVAGRNFLAPPTGSTTLTGVAVTTHQLSISLPIR